MENSETAAQLRRQLTAFAQFTTRSLGKTDLDALMLDACLRARAGTGVSHAKLMEYLPDQDRLILRAGVGWKEGYVGQYSVPPDLDTVIGQAFAYSHPVAVEDYQLRNDIRFPSILKEHGCVSSVNVPINTEDGPFGVLEIDHVERRSFSADDEQFLTGLGNTVAQTIQLKRTVARLSKALDERQMFAREMNHRIKNNLGLVSAMLALQSRREGEPTLRAHFNDAIQRINNLALVHDRMQLFDSMNEPIDALAHFRELAQMLRSLVPPNVVIQTDCSGSILPDCIEAVTLITNELVTNAAKYAFEGRDSGEIVIGFRQEGPGWRLWVHDDGQGLADREPQKPSFGSELIAALASRVQAQVHRKSDKGTRVELTCGVTPME
jgi:two-component sensor histidine kinase/putative methionine-R-sulfoxide reductase with GAF domain